ncbi:RNA polymerase sigma factor [Haloferula sp. A504]|uniref:RNA polymerase sigma factor n=1 Tax=Haloferula sp. A504 TaxID=3373601 RepID=UPI0031C7C830|nr:sigma-70 family RNA polymerase sigma factor [Verrucomicrobiaceae bacterium E54]
MNRTEGGDQPEGPQKNSRPPADPTDEDLIDGINGGDERSFQLLYDRHGEWVLRMAWRISGDEHVAQDVAQEVFRYFLGKFPGFELRCRLRTFLYPAIRNLSIGALRRERRFVGGESGALVIERMPAADPRASEFHEFHRIIGRLSPDHREVLLLRFVDGMTLPEIAELTGIPLGTAKSRLHHALAALRADHDLENPAAPVNESGTEDTSWKETR